MAESTCQDSVIDFPEIAPFDPTKKKKKQHKNKDVIRHHTDDFLHSLVNRADALSLSEQARDDYPALMKNIRGLQVSTKLINTPSDFNIDAAEVLHGHGVEDEEDDDVVQQSKYTWEGSEHDYQYKELLRRLFSFMNKDNPEPAGDRQRMVLRPPQILSDGTAHTVFVNFMNLCKTMHRPPEHVKAYMLKEIGSFGSLDGENRLVVEGRFAPSSFEELLQRYINEYVLCNCCRSPDTIHSKDCQLQCEMCGSERSVSPVYAGNSTRLGRKKTRTFLQ